MMIDYSETVRTPAELVRVSEEAANEFPEAFQAWLNGNPIQLKFKEELEDTWTTVEEAAFDSPGMDYRPVPKKRASISFHCDIDRIDGLEVRRSTWDPEKIVVETLHSGEIKCIRISDPQALKDAIDEVMSA